MAWTTGAAALGTALASNCALTSLDLGHTRACGVWCNERAKDRVSKREEFGEGEHTTAGVEALVMGSVSSVLSRLCLDDNELGSRGARVLPGACRRSWPSTRAPGWSWR